LTDCQVSGPEAAGSTDTAYPPLQQTSLHR
jgi:hypothetical protein